MLDVLTGFFTIWVVIGVGILFAHIKVLDATAQRILALVAFNVGLPAMLFVALMNADIAKLFSLNVAAIAIAIVITGVIYQVLAIVFFSRDAGHRIIGTFASTYMNANNMGFPIAAYVLGDPSWAAPVLMINQLLLQPVGLAALDIVRSRGDGRRSLRRALSLPFRNPMTLAVMAGVVANLIDLQIPKVILDPITLLGGLGVPALLVSFGISLRLSEPPKKGPDLTETIMVSAIKLFVLPLIALLVARFVFNLDAFTTTAVAVMAGLPAAQNVYVFAMRSNQSITMARDVVMITSIGCIASITLMVGLLNLIW